MVLRKVNSATSQLINVTTLSLFSFLLARQPPSNRGLLVVEASRSHSDTPQSVGLLWTSDQPVADTST